MSVKNEYLSPCGMYCSICSVRAAYQNSDQKLKDKLAAFFGTSSENIVCEGCMSGKTFQFAKACSIRACAQNKNLKGCHECDDFPCNIINNFPMKIAINGILESVPRRNELGTEGWGAEVENQYTCSKCGTLLYRHATECSNCQSPFPKR